MPSLRSPAIALTLTLSVCGSSHAVADAGEVLPPPELSALRGELAGEVDDGALPSVAIGVLSQSKLLWLEAIGWADRETERPATVETPYGLASLGKSITATAVMALVERGEIELDRPINSYLGETGLFSPAGHAGQATVRHVLDMTAAIPHGNYTYFRQRDCERLTPQGLVRERGLVALPPGEVHVYSNFAYAVLEHLIERRSGQSYADFLASEVFTPLGMEHASVADSTAPAGAAARYGEDGERLEAVCPRPRSSRSMNASLMDLIHYARFHLGITAPGQRPILSRAALQRMHRERGSPAARAQSLTALGWGSIELEEGLLWLLTNGRGRGAQSTLTLLPSEGLAVAVLVNATGNQTDGLAFRIVDRLVPGFLDQIAKKQERWEALAYRPYEPSAALLGSWAGSVAAPGGPLPLELEFQADGDVHVLLNDGYPALLSGLGWREGLLEGSFLGELPLEEAAGHPHRIDLALLPRADGIEGWALAVFANERGRFALPAYLALSRKPAPDGERPAAP